MTVYLELDELLRVVTIAGLGPVRDVGLLHSALSRPRTTLMGEDAYPFLEDKAAALLHSLVENHALADGNKRLGWLAVIIFFGLNGRRVTLSQSEAFDVVWAVADGSLNELAAIASKFANTARS